MKERTEELGRRRAEIREMGGPARVAKQRAKGKSTARDRIAWLTDEGSFLELGIHGSEAGAEKVPADGVITGLGRIEGREVCIAAYDFTVKGGTMGEVGETKVTRLRELALKNRTPIVWLVDSGGARIDPSPDTLNRIAEFADTGYLFREQVVMSGVVPQVAAMVGPGAAGTAYIPGLADFVPMVKGTGSMALAGPALVKAAVNEEVTAEELGGSAVHNQRSGCADLEVEDDRACIDAVRKYLSYFPSHCGALPERAAIRPPAFAQPDAILEVLPDDPRRTYDVRDLLPHIADEGSQFEMKPQFARSLVTTFCRIDGWSCGVVANNPKYLGGILDSDASYKASRFVNLCDAFNIPLVFLVDVPGFIVGTRAEHQGIIRHGAQMVYAVARATVPKLTVILRRSYGAGYYVMCGRAFEPDLLVAWPTAEIAIMGPAGMVGIAGDKVFAGMGDAEAVAALKTQLQATIQERIDIYEVARRGYIDDVIDPRETRKVLSRGLALTRGKQVERPWRRHGVYP